MFNQICKQQTPEIHFDSIGTPLPLNVLLNLERLRPKRLFVILSMRLTVENIAELNNVHKHSSESFLHVATVNEYCTILFEINFGLEINMLQVFTGELYLCAF